MHGGNRKGAGRPKGTGKYKDQANRVLRVPDYIFDEVRLYRDKLRAQAVAEKQRTSE